MGKNFLTDGKHKRERKHILSLSEIMTIAIYYHYSEYQTFKHYYLRCIKKELRSCFNELPSYNRFIELKKKVAFPLDLDTFL